MPTSSCQANVTLAVIVPHAKGNQVFVVNILFHSTAITQADTLDMVVSVACHNSSVVMYGLADHAGAVPVHAEINTCHAATAANLVYAVVEDAYAKSHIAWDAIVRLVQSFAANVFVDPGNVYVAASVHDSVIVLFIVATLPDAAFTQLYENARLDAVVGVFTTAVTITAVFAHSITMVFAHDDCTVTNHVD